MNNIYLIMGRSGSGKSSVVERLCDRYHWKQVESYTTRPLRSVHESGHCFLDPKVFPNFNAIERVFADIVARTEYNGYCYFCTKQQIDDADFYIVDPPGVKALKENYHGGKGVVTIYVQCDMPYEYYDRMLARGDTPVAASHRLSIDDQVFANANQFADYAVNNTDLDACVKEIAHLIFLEENK